MTRAEQELPRAKRARSRIPTFKNVEEAAEFFDTHSLAEFEDELEEVTDVRFVVERAGPRKAITVRLGQDAAAALTKRAHEQGLASSTLARLWILERLRKTPAR